MNTNVSRNMRRIVVLCKERNVPFNYAPLVDAHYMVLYPGACNQFVITRKTCFSDIPSEVFAELDQGCTT